MLLASCLQGQQPQEQDIGLWTRLPRFEEKSLRDGGETHVYRQLLSTPFWGRAIARLTIRDDGSGLLVTKAAIVDPKHCGDNPCPMTTKTRPLGVDEVKGYLALIKGSGFWTLPREEQPPRSKVFKDADSCILEGWEAGSYHAIQRSVVSQKANAIENVCSGFAREAMKDAYREVPDKK